MDKPSHFYSGITSQQIFDPSYNNFSEIEPNTSSSYLYDKSQPQSEYQEYQKTRNDNNWKSENFECKQEIDPTSYMQSASISETSNYDSESEFNEPYQYGYNHVAPSYTADSNSTVTSGHKNNAQQHRMGPYHMSMTKNQLPSWYNPPPPKPYYPQPPNMFQHQYPYPSNFTGAQTTPVEPNMRNMIHLTSRYFQPFWSNDKSSKNWDYLITRAVNLDECQKLSKLPSKAFSRHKNVSTLISLQLVLKWRHNEEYFGRNREISLLNAVT